MGVMKCLSDTMGHLLILAYGDAGRYQLEHSGTERCQCDAEGPHCTVGMGISAVDTMGGASCNSIADALVPLLSHQRVHPAEENGQASAWEGQDPGT